MNDKDLIGLVARIWVENGGDGLGFVYCYDKILTAILEKLKEEHDTLQEKQKEINPDNNSDKVSGRGGDMQNATNNVANRIREKT